MKLRFIGADGSMGLHYREIYDVTICNSSKYILVYWKGGYCPYSSPQTFAENWEGI